jgi:hypothetical protein
MARREAVVGDAEDHRRQPSQNQDVRRVAFSVPTSPSSRWCNKLGLARQCSDQPMHQIIVDGVASLKAEAEIKKEWADVLAADRRIKTAEHAKR